MKSQFKFKHALRVRFAETDLQAIVFNSNYLIYYDVAWLEYYRATGMSRDELMQLGKETVLARMTLEFKSPARCDDVVEICARVSRIGNTSIVFEYEIYREGEEELIGSASAVYVQTDSETLLPVRVPDALRERISALEGVNIQS